MADEAEAVDAVFEFVAEFGKDLAGRFEVGGAEVRGDQVGSLALVEVIDQVVLGLSAMDAAEVFRIDAGPEEREIADVAMVFALADIGRRVFGELRGAEHVGNVLDAATAAVDEHVDAFDVDEIREQVGQVIEQTHAGDADAFLEAFFHETGEPAMQRMIIRHVAHESLLQAVRGPIGFPSARLALHGADPYFYRRIRTSPGKGNLRESEAGGLIGRVGRQITYTEPTGSGPIRTSELQYELPPELIAQRPIEPRDASRLLIVDRARGEFRHGRFGDIVDMLRSGDCLVRNTTKVIPAKFEAFRDSGARVGGLFLRELAPGRWACLLSNVRRVRDGEPLRLGESAWHIAIASRGERGECEVTVDPPDAATDVLARVGRTPLPPYIRRDGDAAEERREEDVARYQTVFAEIPGAVAAPTAGLHFTRKLMDRVGAMGVGLADVTLHVGLGTFQPVVVEDLADHDMHSEWYEMTSSTADRIRSARAAGGRSVAVGTTSVRVLESVAAKGELSAASGWTKLLIYPPYAFRATDALLTNFHLPGSTLLALVSAFCGYELTMAAYGEAVRAKYRFFSYGDAMLIV